MPTRHRDLIGNVYGELTVIDKAPDKLVGKTYKYHRTQWLCQCSCGKVLPVQEQMLIKNYTKSCGHLKHDAMIKAAKSRFVDLSGRVFGNLLVKQRVDDYVSKSGRKYMQYDCECLLCGKIKTIQANNLRSGSTKTCGECGPNALQDLTGKTFGELCVQKRLPSIIYPNGNQVPIWECKCSCGRIVVVRGQYLRDGSRTDCGHLQCSTAERKIRKHLDKLHIDYVPEYTFNDLIATAGYPLRFDFAIFQNDKLICLIEYQGEQHYWGYQYGYTQREITDPMKRQYCTERDIPLFEIRFDEDLESKLNEILQANSVLSVV